MIINIKSKKKKIYTHKALRFIESRYNDMYRYMLTRGRRGIFNFRCICILAGRKGTDNRGDVFFGRLERWMGRRWGRGYVDEIS